MPQRLPRSRKRCTLCGDPHNRYGKAIGIVFDGGPELREVYQKFGIDLEKSQGDDSWTLPLAATFVDDAKRSVMYAFVDFDYKKRAEPSWLVEELKAVGECL